MGIGLQELLLVLVLVLVFFGAEKIPQLAKSLGKGIGEFRKAQMEVGDELLKETGLLMPTATPPDLPTFDLCPACQGRTAAGSLFCSQCGQHMPVPSICGVCQRTLQPDERFCPNCGHARG